MVVVPAVNGSSVFVTGSVFVKSNIVLYVQENATLRGASFDSATLTNSTSHPEYPFVYDRQDTWTVRMAALINGAFCAEHPPCPALPHQIQVIFLHFFW